MVAVPPVEILQDPPVKPMKEALHRRPVRILYAPKEVSLSCTICHRPMENRIFVGLQSTASTQVEFSPLCNPCAVAYKLVPPGVMDVVEYDPESSTETKGAQAIMNLSLNLPGASPAPAATPLAAPTPGTLGSLNLNTPAAAPANGGLSLGSIAPAPAAAPAPAVGTLGGGLSLGSLGAPAPQAAPAPAAAPLTDPATFKQEIQDQVSRKPSAEVTKADIAEIVEATIGDLKKEVAALRDLIKKPGELGQYKPILEAVTQQVGEVKNQQAEAFQQLAGAVTMIYNMLAAATGQAAAPAPQAAPAPAAASVTPAPAQAVATAPAAEAAETKSRRGRPKKGEEAAAAPAAQAPAAAPQAAAPAEAPAAAAPVNPDPAVRRMAPNEYLNSIMQPGVQYTMQDVHAALEREQFITTKPSDPAQVLQQLAVLLQKLGFVVSPEGLVSRAA